MAELKKLSVDFNSFPLFTRELSTDYLFGENNGWISDVWTFWDFIIQRHKTKMKKAEKKYAFLQSLLEQARNFFQAAERAPIKSQPLLYYYSFMNLAKIVINVSVDDRSAIWRDKIYIHGLIDKTGSLPSLTDSKVICKVDNYKASVAQLFLAVMGDTVIDGQDFKVRDLMSACIGIHRAYSQTYNTKETFFRLEDCEASVEGRKMHFKAYVHDCSDSNVGTLNAFYQNINDLDEKGQHTHKYEWNENIDREKYGPCTKQDFYYFASNLKRKGVWGITNGEDVSLYISNSSIRLSAESIIYMLMFFFGSITRYRPYVFDELLSDKNKWLMNEFLKTQPKQFLYLVTSRVLGRNIRQSWMTKL